LLRRCHRIARSAEEGIETLAPERQRTLSTLINGDFLQGLEITAARSLTGGSSPSGDRFRGCFAALLEHLVRSVSR